MVQVAGSNFNEQELAVGIILIVVSTVSIVSSALIIRLLHALNRWNGYLRVVYYLTLSQLVYDGSFFLLLGFRNIVLRAAYNSLSISSGTAVTLWTNLVSAMLYYIVSSRAHFRLDENFWWLLLLMYTISAVNGTVNAYYAVQRGPGGEVDVAYYWFRLASICSSTCWCTSTSSALVHFVIGTKLGVASIR